MNHLVIPNGDTGLSQAWIMATVGSKSTHRRSLKRDLGEVFIPTVCEEVSDFARETRLLRLTSNLLYGLSLIYKQKVAFMATDLSLIHDRIATPLFQRAIAMNQASKRCMEHEYKSKVACMPDSSAFDINAVFVNDFPLLENDINHFDESFKHAMAIQSFDQNAFCISKTDPLPDYIVAERQDKLFLDYINKSVVAKDILLEECLTVDFEFNQDGEIVGPAGATVEGHDTDVLLDLNLDEEFNAVSGSIEDITKTPGNSTDQAMMQLNPSKAMVTVGSKTARKRRRLRLVLDEITTSRPNNPLRGRRSQTIHEGGLVSDVFRALSLSQPPFLNMCYRMIFGPSMTSGMSPDKLPLSLRHPGVTNLDSFLKDIDDIERGRDVPSRRPSLSLIDEAIYGSPFQTPIDEDPFENMALDIEPLSPMLEDLAEEELVGTRNTATQKLEEFLVFLQERAHSVAESGTFTAGEPQFTFESLIPSDFSSGESVSRSLAANSFACLLQLASSETISLLTGPTEKDQPCKPAEVFINFN